MKKNMKRFVSLVLVLAMALTFAACTTSGNGDVTTDGADTSDAVTTAAPVTTTPETDAPEPEDEPYAYLFAYFTGNDPQQERICFAVSTDGYNFEPLNGGKPVIKQELGTGCVRDPYIFKGHDGAYYIIGTDMKSSLGWSSNRDLISWRSEDLINWTDETIIEVDGAFRNTKNTTRAWAPQAMWNEERGEYMIYFALCSGSTSGKTQMYYAYSPDLKTLSGAPELLFAPTNGHDAIDSDIVYNDGLYYMFFKDETSGGIHLMTSKQMDSGWDYDTSVQVSPKGLAVEGSSTYPLIDGSGWLLIADAYMNGYFVMSRSADLENFRQVSPAKFSFNNFTPRHGSVIHITEEEYNALLDAFPMK